MTKINNFANYNNSPFILLIYKNLMSKDKGSDSNSLAQNLRKSFRNLLNQAQEKPSNSPDPESFSNRDFHKEFGHLINYYNEFYHHQNHDDKDVRIPNPAEMAGITSSFAISMVNGFSRQVVTNLKLLSDLNQVSFAEAVRKNPQGVFTNGMLPRLGYQMFGILPALQVRDSLTKRNHSSLTISLATSLAETVCRFPFEASNIKKSLEQIQKEKVSYPEIGKIMHRSFYPFFVRNCLAWAVINNSGNALQERIFFGCAAGAFSTCFETFGNYVIKNSKTSQNFVQCYEKSLQDLKSGPKSEMNNLARNLFRGFQVRGISGGLSALLLAKATEDKLEESVLPYFEILTQYLEKNGFKINEKDYFHSSSQTPSASCQEAFEDLVFEKEEEKFR